MSTEVDVIHPWSIAACCVLSLGLVSFAAEVEKAEPPKVTESTAQAGTPEEADLKAMQGRWTYQVKNAAGVPIRIEKAVDGTSDTVTHFDANGNVIHAHASTFELKRQGPLRIFTIKTQNVIAGPNQGMQRPVPRSFIYRIEGNDMIECWGLLETDRGPATLIYWNRVKE
jgi:hypothetical protein